MNDNDHSAAPAARAPERSFLAVDETPFIDGIDERDISFMRSLARRGRARPITIMCCSSDLHRPEESEHHTHADGRAVSASQDTA